MKTYKQLTEELNEKVRIRFKGSDGTEDELSARDYLNPKKYGIYKDGYLEESWEEHKKIFQSAYSFLDDNQTRKVKGDYSLDTLKSLHTDAMKRVKEKYPHVVWEHDKIHTFSPSEEGYGTHVLSSQSQDDETGHNFLIHSSYRDGHHVTSIDYGS